MSKFLARVIPFLLLGMALVAFAFGLLLFTYLLVFGAIVGVALYAATWLKQKFFPSKQIIKRKSGGHIIDQ